MEVHTDRRYRFAATPDAVWGAIADVDGHPGRWPWLTRFDATSLALGERWDCELRPPLVPYRLQLVLEFTEVERPRRIHVVVTGDIGGDAEVRLSAFGAAGCEVRLVSSLEAQRGVVRALGTVAPWLARAGHDWVLWRGARQLGQSL